MLADDIERVTSLRPIQKAVKQLPKGISVVAGTLGKSRLIEGLVKSLKIDVSGIRDRWESFIVLTTEHPKYHTPLMMIVGSDRRGTAFGLTSLTLRGHRRLTLVLVGGREASPQEKLVCGADDILPR